MTAAILEKINDLPEHLQDDVENYIANPSESLTISELKENFYSYQQRYI